MGSLLLRLLAGLIFAGLFIYVYLRYLRPWQLSWGATEEEVWLRLPGDELVGTPHFQATRGITIETPPNSIWPWILQMGDGRAGFYSYDWFDNRFERSAEYVLPQFQGLIVGDEVPIFGSISMKVASMDLPRSMVWVGGDPLRITWTWFLLPIDPYRTRLITRLRSHYILNSPRVLIDLIFDIGDFPFMRNSMEGIKQRAEGDIIDRFWEDVVQGVLWIIPLIEFLASFVLIFTSQSWLLAWIAAALSLATFFWTFYRQAPVWQDGILVALVTLALML